MSGGSFEYLQYRFNEIIEPIKDLIFKNGKPKTREEIKAEDYGRDPDWYEKYPEDKFHIKYSDEVIEQFKIAVQKVKEAQIYTHRIDWLISGDDGEESFLRRLKEELNELENLEEIKQNKELKDIWAEDYSELVDWETFRDNYIQCSTCKNWSREQCICYAR